MRNAFLALVMALTTVTAACSPGDSYDENAAAGDTVATQPYPGAQNRPATAQQDPDVQFLQMMSNHHQGVIEWSELAMQKGTTPTVQADAHKLHLKQQAEQDSMLAILRRDYQVQHRPVITPKNRAQLDTLSARTGAAFDTTYYRMVIDHHRMGIGMIDEFLPRMTKPAVREMAERMKREQEQEITEFRQKI